MIWEYRVVRLSDANWACQQHRLNCLGSQGWELVAMLEGIAYLKRARLPSGTEASC